MDSVLKQFGVLMVLWYAKTPVTRAGLCWQHRHRNGTCYGPISQYSTEESCCTSDVGVAFSPMFIKGSIFKYAFVTIPACVPCKGACDRVKCDKDKKCVITAEGTALCRCNPDCTGTHSSKVCGSDGKTYSSECALLHKRCLSDRNLSVEYLGSCKAMCRNVKCFDGKVCLTDRNGRSYCVPRVCPKSCRKPTGRQVCGTDHMTYPDMCHLLKSGCKLGRKISLAYLGSCKDANCDNVNCPSGKSCVIDSAGMPRCISCKCDHSQHSLPICGSDGKRHKSWCHMRKTSCQIKKLLKIDFSVKC